LAAKGDPILVVGGGLGGASVALALARKGFAMRLMEQAPEFGVIGYGIQLGPNVFPMFDRLGVTEKVLKQALIPNAGIDRVDHQHGVGNERLLHYLLGDAEPVEIGRAHV